MKYWLMKTEPDTFSWDDLKSAPNQSAEWEGVRNYQARNFMRDEMKVGDQVFIYHSQAKPLVIAGIAEVVKEGYPDHHAHNPDSPYYDPKSSPEEPRWFMVDVKAKTEFDPPVTRDALKDIPELKEMMLLQRGSRLSIQPVTESEWEIVSNLHPTKKV